MMTTVSILHITMKLVKSLQNNLSTLIYSLVNGLYKITTESIKLVLAIDFEQYRTSSNLIIPILDVQEVSYFFSSYSVKAFHGFHRISIEYFSAYSSP